MIFDFNQASKNTSLDVFNVTKYTTICEKHFTNDDIIVSIVSKRKKLKRGAEPSIYLAFGPNICKKCLERKGTSTRKVTT